MISLATCLLFSLCASLAPASLAPQESVEALIKSFRSASISRDLDVRREALAALVASADLAAGPELFVGFGRASDELGEALSKRAKLNFALEREELRLALLENSPQKKREWTQAMNAERERITELEKDLGKTAKKLEREGPWLQALSDALAEHFELLSASDRKKLIKELDRDASKGADEFTQRTALNVLGHIGPAGTVLDLHGWIEDWRGTEERHYRSIPKLMEKVRELETRMQELGNSPDLVFLYDSARAEARVERKAIRALDERIHTAVGAAGRALAREDESLEKTIKKLLKAVDKQRGRVRLDTIQIFANVPTDGAASAEIRAAVRAGLVGAKAEDGLVVGSAIDALVALEDRELPTLIVDGLLTHEHEYVRTRAIAALDRLRAKVGIPALIERLAVEEGRARTDISRALASLTAKDFHGNVELWRRWWKEHGESFEVAPRSEGAAEGAADSQIGVTFFGIETESQRMLFVIDTSLSMTFTTAPRPGVAEGNQNNWPRLMPTEDEVDRMTVARRALVKALGGLEDGAIFNFVVYASDVWTWQDDLVEMDAELRAEALEFIDAMQPKGGTNIQGALTRAFELAGVDSVTAGEWSEPRIDTIYLLTDGTASVGVTTDTEDILADIATLNRTAGIVIHTIGLSDGHDAELLRRLAEENGGTYVGS